MSRSNNARLRVIPFQPSGEVRKAIDCYLHGLTIRARAGAVAKATLDGATFYLQSFAAMHGHKAIADCRSTDLLEWLLAHPEWESPHTKSDAVKHVVTCFNVCEAESIIARRPYRRPKGLWDAPQPRTAMRPEEYALIMELARQCRGRLGGKRRRRPSAGRFRCAIFFLWETGARTCEMREADVTHYDQAGNAIILPPSKHKTGRKTGKPRIIPLGKAGRLIRWLCRGRTAGPIFRSSWGRKGWAKDNFARLFRMYANLAGVRAEVTAYCCRHGFTCQAKARGVDSLQLAHVLGQTTARYIESVYGKSLLEDAAYLAKIQAKAKGDEPPTDKPK